MDLTIYKAGTLVSEAVNIELTLLTDGINTLSFQLPVDFYTTWLAYMDADLQVRKTSGTVSLGYFFINSVVQTGSTVDITAQGIKGKLKYWQVPANASKGWIKKGIVGDNPAVGTPYSLDLHDDDDVPLALLDDSILNKYIQVEDGTLGDDVVECNLGPDAGSTPCIVPFSSSETMDTISGAYTDVKTSPTGSSWKGLSPYDDLNEKEMVLDIDVENYAIPDTATIVSIDLEIHGETRDVMSSTGVLRGTTIPIKFGIRGTTDLILQTVNHVIKGGFFSTYEAVDIHIVQPLDQAAIDNWLDKSGGEYAGGHIFVKWTNRNEFAVIPQSGQLGWNWYVCKLTLTYRTATFDGINTKITTSAMPLVTVSADDKGYVTDVVADVTGHVITLTNPSSVEEDALAGQSMTVDGHTYTVDSNTQFATNSRQITPITFPTSLSYDKTYMIRESILKLSNYDIEYTFEDDGHTPLDCCMGLTWAIYITDGHVYAIKNGIATIIAGTDYVGCCYVPPIGTFPTETYPNECFILWKLTDAGGAVNSELWTDVAGTMTYTTKYSHDHFPHTMEEVHAIHTTTGHYSSDYPYMGLSISFSDVLRIEILGCFVHANGNLYVTAFFGGFNSPDAPLNSYCDRIFRISGTTGASGYWIWSCWSSSGYHMYYYNTDGYMFAGFDAANPMDDGDTGDDKMCIGTDGTYIYAIDQVDSHIYKGTLDIAGNPDSVTWEDLDLDHLAAYPFTDGAVNTDQLVLYNGDVFTTIPLPVVPFAITMIENPVAGDETNNLVLNISNNFYTKGVAIGDIWTITKDVQTVVQQIFQSTTPPIPSVEGVFNRGTFIDEGTNLELVGCDADTMWNALAELMNYISYVDSQELTKDLIRADPEDSLSVGSTLTGFNWINDLETSNNIYGAVSLVWRDGVVTELTGISNFKTFPMVDKSILTANAAKLVCHRKVEELTTYHRAVHLNWMTSVLIRPGFVYTFTILGTSYTEYCRRVTYKQTGNTVIIDAYFGGGHTPPEEAVGRHIGLIERKLRKNDALPLVTSSGGGSSYTDADAQAACVANSITDGVTTSAPNQNQVFDALAAKLATTVKITTVNVESAVDLKHGVNDANTSSAPVHADGAVDDGDLHAPSGDAVFHAIAAGGGWSGDWTDVEALGDHGYHGITFTATAGENLAIGDFVYFKSDTKMWLAKADAIATAKCIGVCVVAGNAEAEVTIMTYGFIRHDAFAAMTVGGIVYLSTGTAGIQQKDTVPSTNAHCIVVLGQAIAAYILFFNPNNMIIEIIA